LPVSAHVKRAALVLLLLGLAAAVALVVYADAGEVLSLLVVAGWWGLLLIAVVHAMPVLANAVAWRALLSGVGVRAGFVRLFLLRALADGINALLPVASVGGDLVRAHVLARSGVEGATAGASVVVDLTLGLLTLVLFIVFGLLLIGAHGGLGGVPIAVAAAVAAFSLLLGGFFAAQRSGVLLKLARRLEGQAVNAGWQSITGGMAALDRAVVAGYANAPAVLIATAWRMAAWFFGAFEIWVIFQVIGRPVTLGEAVIVETIAQAVRNMGFAIPGGLGVQEGGYLLAGRLIGVGDEVGLALALVKRVRDLIWGVPALLAWQYAEGRRLWRRGAGQL
jgi:putative membrane protein